jgi:hypothetical protein
MSSLPSENTSAPYDDAEKGTAEIDVVTAPATAMDEKKGNSSTIAVTTEVVSPPNTTPTATANTAPTTLPAAKPPKKKVSKWILWTLWFNTYRFVSIMTISHNSNSNPASPSIL